MQVKQAQTCKVNVTAAKCPPMSLQLLSVRRRGRLRIKRWGQSCGARAVLGKDVKGNRKGKAAQDRTGVAGNRSCGCEIGRCKKVLVGCLGRSHEVVMDRKTHSGVYRAAVILVPSLSCVSSIFKLTRRREKESYSSGLPYKPNILVAQWPVFAGVCRFREVAAPDSLACFSVAPGRLLSPPVCHFEKHSQRSILG